MKRSPFHQPKPVLIFNGAYILVGITRSIRSASEISGGNAQAISFACTGRYISAGSFYFRHIHPDIEIEITDLDTLKLQDYDKMCHVERRYHSVREMARRKKLNVRKRKNNPINDNEHENK